MFHMLRRQMRRPYRKPLVVMSPKSLLRHRLCTSTREELARGGFEVVMDDPDGPAPADVRRLVMCSGKVFYDLLEKRREHELEHVAIVRVEQLYPFPRAALLAEIRRFPKAEPVWVQEEPKNMGAFSFVRDRFLDLGLGLAYAGRAASSSPATGSYRRHVVEQEFVLQRAFGEVPTQAVS